MSEELRKTEADRDKFLLVENLNCSLAAERYIRYWKLRARTLGKKKHSALNQTGDGAMERKSLATLGTGFINLLPNDGKGCSVIFIDSLRLRQKDSKGAIQMCLFYMFSILAENKQSQQAGATLLYYIHDAAAPLLDFFHQLAGALPIRISTYLLRLLRLL